MLFIFSLLILLFSLSLNGMDRGAAVGQDVLATHREEWIRKSEATREELGKSQAVHARKLEELRKKFPAQSSELLVRELAKGGYNRAESDQIQSLEQREERT